MIRVFQDSHKGALKSSSRLGFLNLPSTIYTALILRFFHSFRRTIAFPYLVVYLTAKNVNGGLAIDSSSVGFMLMISGITAILTLPLAGTSSDRFGRKKTLLLYFLPQIFLTLLLAFSSSFIEFLILYMIRGAIMSFFDPAYNALIADLAPPSKREEVYGLVYMISNMGVIFGPLLGGLIISFGGYPIVFILSALFMVLCTFILFFSVREPSIQKSGLPTFGQFTEIFQDKLFILFSLLIVLTMMVYPRFYSLLPVHIEYLGFPPYIYGILYSVNGAVATLLQIPIRKISIRIGSLKAFILAQLLFGLGYSSFFLAREFFQLLLGVIVITLGEICFLPTKSHFIASLSSIDKRGRYMAIAAVFSRIGGSTGSLIAFNLYGLFPFKDSIWIFLGLFGFATIPGYIGLHMLYKNRKLKY